MNKKHYYNVLTFLVLLLISACSAQKNTGLSRAYHNLTAKYNVLFNGKESFKSGIEKIDLEFKEDYSEILPVFQFEDKNAVSIASSDMDRTIKKCSKCITLHSITAKPKVKDNKTLSPEERAFFSKKEYNAFVDDAYLLMGKAHFYKHEFVLASEIFRKITNDFKDLPAQYEANLWLARIAIQNNNFIESSDILSLLNNNADFPDKLTNELYPTFANFYLKQKDYPKTLEYLSKTLEIEKQKKKKTRYLYIMAQLYEKTGDLKKASEYYEQVIKMNPPYEMAFNAHINRALAYEQGFGQANEIETELLKMIHDDKNIEYQDQLYFALGNLAIKEGKKEKALEYYSLSIQANKGNSKQLVRSYLTLADYFYGIPDYPNAQSYYDSAITKIDPDYPGYNALFTKSNSLNRLVTEINTVEKGDSLLKLSQLPDAELNRKIDVIIKEERAKEQEAREKQQNKLLDEQFGQEMAGRSGNVSTTKSPVSGSSKWYFYNDAARTMGYREFKLKWGTRRLEDHWQRSSKAVVNAFASDEGDTDSTSAISSAKKQGSDIFSKEYYLAEIPRTDSAVKAVNKDIEAALFNMGLIYKTDLKDYNKANDSFKELIRRYPNSTYVLTAYYNLYGIAREQNNMAMMDYYKNIIASQFPESLYTKILTDPEYFQELERKEKEIRSYYEQTYELFKSGNYSEVIHRSENARKLYPDHALYPQFHYLGVLARGKSLERKEFRDTLNAIIKKYPKTEISADAQNLVYYMDQEHPEIKEAAEIVISKELYEATPSAKYLFAYAFDKKLNSNQLVFNIINFNLDAVDSLNLIVEVVNLNDKQNLVTVKSFGNQNSAQQYLKLITTSDLVLKDIISESPMIPFIISAKNLETLKTDKSVERYLKFYNAATL